VAVNANLKQSLGEASKKEEACFVGFTLALMVRPLSINNI